MRCQVCGKGDQIDGAECKYCGATVRSVLGKGMPLPPGIRDSLDADREEKRKATAAKRKERLLWHAAAGAIILFVVAVCAHLPAILLAPRQALIGILVSIPIALVFGPPIGLITSWRNYGPLGGAIVGSLFFAAGIYLVSGGPALTSLLTGAVPGVFIGGFMGFHVQSDRD